MAFDRWSATQVMTHLRDRFGDYPEAQIVEVRQGLQSMTVRRRSCGASSALASWRTVGIPCSRGWLASSTCERTLPPT
jgi:hypothetical protein